jgi:O-antigen/teichoic acid export membrane protein
MEDHIGLSNPYASGSPDLPMTQLEKARTFFVPKLRQVAHLLMKQGIAMSGNLLYGLLCTRLLPVPEYAKYAVVFGYMGTLTVLLDIGVSGTLAPLVGEQITNLQLIANYMTATRRLAQRLFLIVAPLAALFFVLIVQRQHWGPWLVAQMVVVLLVIAWFARISSAYGAVLILCRDRNRYYRTQMIGSLGSLALLLVFWALHGMNIYVAVLLNVAQILFFAISYFRRAKELLGVKGENSVERERAIVRLALPNLPGIVFYAIQGQILLMLITVFGHTAGVASIGALSRLAQILVFFSQTNLILVEPFFAKLAAGRLKRVYLVSVFLATLCAAASSALAFLFPEIFLWILGPQYSNFRFEVGLLILASSIRYVSGFMWVIHSARRFVYWWNNFFNIGLTLAVQVAVIWKFDLSTVRNVLYLNLATAVVTVIVAVSCGVYGFWRGPQKMEVIPVA